MVLNYVPPALRTPFKCMIVVIALYAYLCCRIGIPIDPGVRPDGKSSEGMQAPHPVLMGYSTTKLLYNCAQPSHLCIGENL